MGQASGISLKGVQTLYIETAGLTNVAIALPGRGLTEAKYAGFFSVEVFNGFNYYQAAGSPIWYEGVFLSNIELFGLTLYQVVANFREAGVGWEVATF